MHAEIHHKISSTGSNLSDQMEDKLTGDVFGALRYLPFSNGLKTILLEGVKWEKDDSKTEFSSLITRIGDHEVSRHLHFWPWRAPVEPDVVFEPPHFHCWIEVKYNSGLSGEDQLVKQAKVMAKSKVPKFLIFLARQEYLPSLSKGDGFPSEVHFGTLSWQGVFLQLQKIKDKQNPGFPFDLILKDILALLEKKGFNPFTGFQLKQQLKIETGFWPFQPGYPAFNFSCRKPIQNEQYFRFSIE